MHRVKILIHIQSLSLLFMWIFGHLNAISCVRKVNSGLYAIWVRQILITYSISWSNHVDQYPQCFPNVCAVCDVSTVKTLNLKKTQLKTWQTWSGSWGCFWVSEFQTVTSCWEVNRLSLWVSVAPDHGGHPALNSSAAAEHVMEHLATARCETLFLYAGAFPVFIFFP